MKKLLVYTSCLLLVCCRQTPDSKFIGKWTDGTWRHISITADSKGFTVEDISGGDKKYRANLFNDELMVKTNKGISPFNYIKETDQLFAGAVLFHREDTAKNK